MLQFTMFGTQNDLLLLFNKISLVSRFIKLLGHQKIVHGFAEFLRAPGGVPGRAELILNF